MKSAEISRRFHSRGAAVIMIMVAAVYMALSGMLPSVPLVVDSCGIAMDGAFWKELSPVASYAGGVCLNVAIMVMMVLINRRFNVLRSITSLEAGLFAVMQAAAPAVTMALSPGLILATAIVLCMYLSFSCYGAPNNRRTIFMVSLLLSLTSVIQYAAILFVPVFWIIIIQMRVFSLRTFMASVLGLMTSWIILLGFGIISPSDISMPDITGVFGGLEVKRRLYLLVLSGITAFMLVASILLNVLKTIAYNARARAYNGALTVLSLLTIIAAMADYGNIAAYLTVLDFCAAYQITHYFVNHRYERQYIGILAVIGVYIILYIWRLIL